MPKKKRGKWVTLVKEEVLSYDVDRDERLPARLEDLTDKDIENDTYEISLEISVIRKDYKHGFDSWGWGGTDKIILFDADEVETVADIEWMKKVAQTTADALNKAKL